MILFSEKLWIKIIFTVCVQACPRHREASPGQGRSEQGRVPLNLYGGKFYQGGGKQQQGSIWERGTKGKEKKSRWTNIKNTFFTPIGTQPDRRRTSRGSPHRSNPRNHTNYNSPTHDLTDSDNIAINQQTVEYQDPSISYLTPCPSYHRDRPSYIDDYSVSVERDCMSDGYEGVSSSREYQKRIFDHSKLSSSPSHSSYPNLSSYSPHPYSDAHRQLEDYHNGYNY